MSQENDTESEECENCGMVDVALITLTDLDGEAKYCQGCICHNCKEPGTMGMWDLCLEWGLCLECDLLADKGKMEQRFKDWP